METAITETLSAEKTKQFLKTLKILKAYLGPSYASSYFWQVVVDHAQWVVRWPQHEVRMASEVAAAVPDGVYEWSFDDFAMINPDFPLTITRDGAGTAIGGVRLTSAKYVNTQDDPALREGTVVAAVTIRRQESRWLAEFLSRDAGRPLLQKLFVSSRGLLATNGSIIGRQKKSLPDAPSVAVDVPYQWGAHDWVLLVRRQDDRWIYEWGTEDGPLQFFGVAEDANGIPERADELIAKTKTPRDSSYLIDQKTLKTWVKPFGRPNSRDLETVTFGGDWTPARTSQPRPYLALGDKEWGGEGKSALWNPALLKKAWEHFPAKTVNLQVVPYGERHACLTAGGDAVALIMGVRRQL